MEEMNAEISFKLLDFRFTVKFNDLEEKQDLIEKIQGYMVALEKAELEGDIIELARLKKEILLLVRVGKLMPDGKKYPVKEESKRSLRGVY